MKFENIYEVEKTNLENIIGTKRLPYTFYAHPEESLDVHLDYTVKQFLYFVEEFKLDHVFDNLLKEISCKDVDILKREIVKIIYLHDWGKINPLFQKAKMDNPLPVKDFYKSSFVFKSTHSKFGYFLYLSHIISQASMGNLEEKYVPLLALLATSILRHHSPLDNIEFSTIFSDEELEEMTVLAKKFKYNDGHNKLKQILEKIDNVRDCIYLNHGNDYSISSDNNTGGGIHLFYLYKLVYSLLITADFYASKWQDNKVLLGTVDKQFFEKISFNFFKKESPKNFNILIEEKKEEIRKIDIFSDVLRKKTKENLNKLRNYLNVYVEDRVEEELKNGKRFFYLSLPTGAGKTNISLRVMLKIMKKVPLIKKVYYVLPFINIIDQIYDYAKSILDLTTEEAIRTDTGAVYEEVHMDEEEKFYMDILFENYPFIFTSHVSFFDSILRKGKAKNFNFFRLANSIIILDEIQAYDDKLWSVLMFNLSQMAMLLNSYIIVMSATLPPIENALKDEYKVVYDFVDLVEENIKDAIYDNPNFLKRVEILPVEKLFFRPFEETDNEDILKFVEERFSECPYLRKYLIVTNTIRKSFELYSLFSNYFSEKNEIFLLNSTILPIRRKEVIDNFKQNSRKRQILISTQVIEAGVDLDADEGLRELAILDSLEQVAGRVNRNAIKDKSYLFIFSSKTFYRIYRGSYRLEVMKDYSKPDLQNRIKYRKFKEFYKDVTEKIYEKGNNRFVLSLQDYIEDFYRLNFSYIDKSIRIIDSYNISLFIPIELEVVKLSSSLRDMFSKYGLISKGDIIKGDVIKGEDVWKKYVEMIEGKDNYNMANIRLFSHLLRQFVIGLSIFHIKKENISITLNHGFFYLKNWEDSYSLETGLNINKFISNLSIRDLDERII